MKPSKPNSILLVDDDDNLRRVVEFQLRKSGYSATGVPSAEAALEALRSQVPDLIITDLLMPGMDGIQLLERISILHPDVVTIVITAHGDVSRAVRAMQLGALDFLEKPFVHDRLLVAVRKALNLVGLRDENRRLRAMVQDHESFENIIGSSSTLHAVLADLRLAADSDATVLILGESGTGKELAARALHLNSPRKENPFVIVNSGAIPENLIESNLFGHRKGAFTGAIEDRKGKFELASGGTIFLDEVAELPLVLQPKLLRVLQEGEVDKVGASHPIQVDVRVVAATHQDLEARVREGTFREDLWYRLNVIPLRMPPLRERRDDIPLLVDHFICKLAERYHRPTPRLSPEVFEKFDRYDWPGNVRELENLLARLIVLAKSDTVNADDLPEAFHKELPRYGGIRLDVPAGGIVLEEVEKGLVEEALRRCRGNKSAAARFLGVSRQTLLYRMQKHGLQ